MARQGGASCPNGRDWDILGGRLGSSRFRRVFCFIYRGLYTILFSGCTEELLWRSTVGQLDVSVVGLLAIW